MNTYIVTVQSDRGKHKIQTDAASATAARQAVIEFENCPDSAVLSVTLLTARTPSEYELALRVGNSRYGSNCRHERTRNGRCLDCQRKVV